MKSQYSSINLEEQSKALLNPNPDKLLKTLKANRSDIQSPSSSEATGSFSLQDQKIKLMQFKASNSQYIEKYSDKQQKLEFQERVICKPFSFQKTIQDQQEQRYQGIIKMLDGQFYQNQYSYFAKFWEEIFSELAKKYLSKHITIEQLKFSFSLSYLGNLSSIYTSIFSQLKRLLPFDNNQEISDKLLNDRQQIQNFILKHLSLKYPPQSNQNKIPQSISTQTQNFINTIEIGQKKDYMKGIQFKRKKNKDYSQLTTKIVQRTIQQSTEKYKIFEQLIKVCFALSQETPQQLTRLQSQFNNFSKSLFRVNKIIRSKREDDQKSNYQKINKIELKQRSKFQKKCMVGTKIDLQRLSNKKQLKKLFDTNDCQRPLSKWMSQLSRFFSNPKQQVQKIQTFKRLRIDEKYQEKTQDDKLKIIKKQKKKLIKLLNKEKVEYDKQMEAINKDMRHLTGHFLFQRQNNSNISVFRHNQTRQVGSKIHFSSKKLLLKQLSVVIHHLIKVGEQMNINLIQFNVNDILRAKMQLNQDAFINMFKVLTQLSMLPKDKFNITRIKDKTQTDTKNVLINFDFLGVPSEIQIQLQSKNQKNKQYHQLSHFIYELRRAPFGVAPQCAKNLCKYDRILAKCTEKIFKETLPSRLKKQKKNINPQSSFFPRVCKKNNYLYVCSNCVQIIFSQKAQKPLQAPNEMQQFCNDCIKAKQQRQFDKDPPDETQEQSELQLEMANPQQIHEFQKNPDRKALNMHITLQGIKQKYPVNFENLALKNTFAIIEYISNLIPCKYIARHQTLGKYRKYLHTNNPIFYYLVEKGEQCFSKNRCQQFQLLNMDISKIKLWIACVARGIIQLQAKGIYHADLHYRNTIMQNEPQQIFKIIDFDKAFKFLKTTKTKDPDKAYQFTIDILKMWFNGSFNNKQLKQIFNISQEGVKELAQLKKKFWKEDNIKLAIPILVREMKKSHIQQFTKLVQEFIGIFMKNGHKIQQSIERLKQSNNYEEFARNIENMK